MLGLNVPSSDCSSVSDGIADGDVEVSQSRM